MTEVAWLAPSPKALTDQNMRDRVIIADKDTEHPPTAESPDGGEIVIAANQNQLPTLAALNQPVQERIVQGWLVKIDESEAVRRRTQIVRDKLERRNRAVALAQPPEAREVLSRKELDAEAAELAKAPEPPKESEPAGDKAPQRANVQQMQDQIRGISDPAQLDAIEANEKAGAGGGRKGVLDAIDAQRQAMAVQNPQGQQPEQQQQPPFQGSGPGPAPAADDNRNP